MTVEFNEPTSARSVTRVSRLSLLSRVVIGLGLAKNEKESQKVLVVVLLITLCATVLVFVANRKHPEPLLPPANIPGQF